MQHIKLSTSRDFRINAAVLQAALDEQELSSDEVRYSGKFSVFLKVKFCSFLLL